MNPAGQVTTGLVPFTMGSELLFELKPNLDWLPWNLAGGIVSLELADPEENITSIPATLDGFQVTVRWTVTGPVGTWSRSWTMEDQEGVHLISRPEAFVVVSAPV